MNADSQLVLARLDAVSKDLEFLRSEKKGDEQSKKEKETSWYEKIIQILGIPAAVFALFLQFGQFNSSGYTNEKTQAETAKLRTDRLSVQIDIEKKLSDLQKARVADSNNADLQKAISSLRDALAQAARLRDAETKGLVANVITKFIIAWFLYQGWGIFGGMFSLFWSSITTPAFVFISNSNYSIERAWIKRLLAPVLIVLINLVPNFVLWYGQLTILLGASRPLAYDAAALIGREQNLSQLILAFQNGKLSALYAQLLALFETTIK